MKVMPADEVRDLKRSLDTDGYVVVRDVVSKERLAELADALDQEYERVRREGELFHGGGSLSGHLNSFPGEGSRFVYDDIAERGILDVARAIDEDKAERLRVTMNYNLPGSARSSTTSTICSPRPSSSATSPSWTRTSPTAPSTCSRGPTIASTGSGSTRCSASTA